MSLPLAKVGTGRWTLDPAKSTVAFRHKTMWGLVTVKGTFGEVGGDGESSAGSGRGTLRIAAATLDTHHTKRDTHLRSPHFFDTENHPSIVFTALDITPTGEETADVRGELTVRGVTKPLTVSARATESAEDAVTLTAELDIDRADYGLTWNMLGMLTGRTSVTITTRFTQSPSATAGTSI